MAGAAEHRAGWRDLFTGKGGTRGPGFGRWNLTSSCQRREEMEAAQVNYLGCRRAQAELGRSIC